MMGEIVCTSVSDVRVYIIICSARVPYVAPKRVGGTHPVPHTYWKSSASPTSSLGLRPVDITIKHPIGFSNKYYQSF